MLIVDIYVVTPGENYPVIERDDDDDGQYTVDHVVVANPGRNYKNEDVIRYNNKCLCQYFYRIQNEIKMDS